LNLIWKSNGLPYQIFDMELELHIKYGGGNCIFPIFERIRKAFEFASLGGAHNYFIIGLMKLGGVGF